MSQSSGPIAERVSLSLIDLRTEVRQRVLLKGIIYAGLLGLHCDVIDFSRSGCQIVCARIAEAPDAFDLSFMFQAARRSVHVIWRRDTTAGLLFERPPDR